METEKNNLDGIEPVDTLSLADAPPFPPHPGAGTGAAPAGGGAGRGEQQSGDECETKEVKEHHSEVLKVGRKDGGECSTLPHPGELLYV